MDNIEQSFLALGDHLSKVQQGVDEGQFLTEQVCSEMFRLVDEVRQEQKRCMQTLQDVGIKDPVCSSVSVFRTQMEECQRKAVEKQIAAAKQVMKEFLSLFSTSGVHTAKLNQLFRQIDLSDETALLHIMESGELAQYQTFLDFVRAGTADYAALEPLTGIFGYDLAFALMGGDLRLGGPETSAEEKDSEAEKPQEPEQEPETQMEQKGTNVSGNVTTETVSAWLIPIQPIKEQKPTVEGFRKILGKLPVDARVLLPALSQFGVLTLELAVRIGMAMDWAVAQPDEQAYRTQVAKVLQELEKRGFVARYNTEAGEVFCLTAYGYGCLHRSKILEQAKHVFAVPMETHGTSVKTFAVAIGQHQLTAQPRMDAAVLCRTLDEVRKVCEYLEWIRQSSENAEEICCSLTWKAGHYEVKTPCADGTTLCLVCFEASPGENALYLTEAAPKPCPATGTAVWFSGGMLLHWDAAQGEWGYVHATKAVEMEGPVHKTAGQRAEPEEVTGAKTGLEPEPAEKAEPMSEALAEKAEPTSPAEEIGQALKTPAEPMPEPDHHNAPSCAQEYARAFLAQDAPVLPDQLLSLTVRMLGEERFAEANALAEAIALDPGAPKWAEGFYQTFRQAVQVPSRSYQYSSGAINELQNALPSEELELQSLQQSMVRSILLWAMAFPSDHYDHDLYNHSKMVLGNNADDTIRSLIELLSEELKGISFQYDGFGFSPLVLNNLIDNKEREKRLAELRSNATALKATPTSTISLPGLESCLKLLVGPASKIGKALACVAKDDRTGRGDIQTMLENTFGVKPADSEMEKYIDHTWNELRRKDSNVKVKRLDPDTAARNKCKNALSDRLNVIREWLDLITVEQGTGFESLRNQYARTVSRLKDALTELAARPLPEELYERAGQAVMRRTAKRMLGRLEGVQGQESQNFSSPLWQTPDLVLSESGEHLVVKELYGVEGVEPWRLVLRAVAAGPEDLDDILDQIPDCRYSPRWNYNYGTEKWVLESRGEACPDRSAECQKAQKAAEEEIRGFQSQVRMDWAEGKIQEHEKETAFAALETVKDYYFNAHNYASLRRFIRMLQDGIERRARIQTEEYREKARQLEEQYPGVPMLEAIRQALDRGSLLNAYSYITQLENGITQRPIIEKPLEGFSSYLTEFQGCEEKYFQECQKYKSSSLANCSEKVLEKMPETCRHWSSDNEKKKGCNWLSHWITGYGNSNTNRKIQDLLTGLGFQVNEVKKRGDTAHSQTLHEVYEVSAEKTSHGRTDYPHPIYKFGTHLTDPFYVVCLFGCRGANTLIDLMTNWLQLNGPTIVFMDGTLSVGDRRRTAEAFKSNTSGQNAFLLIDRVLLLYLASLDEGSRLNAMLHCTLPYTFEMLYGNGVSTVPDEMFIGRTAAMNDLRSEQGSDLVYGGRQLGKTALLRRASNTLDHPEIGAYSFYVEVKDEGSTVLLEKANQRLMRLGLLQQPEKDIASLCRTLRALYEDGKLQNLRIFVDESDQLFEEFSQDSYRSLRPFIELRNETAHHVKFVFAGTHNVAAMDSATDRNNNLVHMKSLCIEPLSLSDAVKLIRIPMTYLGFEIGDQEIDLILTNTNNYPGLIHMFCRALVQSVCSNYSTYYANQEKLPYRIEREQMQAVFKENDIRREMGIRVMATIKLNAKYKTISNLLAHRLYEAQSAQGIRIFGYSAQELLDYNRKELDIHLLNQMSLQDMKALMDEMCQMGILYKTSQGAQGEYYRFRQREFLQFIGSAEEVLNTLLPKEEAK